MLITWGIHKQSRPVNSSVKTSRQIPLTIKIPPSLYQLKRLNFPLLLPECELSKYAKGRKGLEGYVEPPGHWVITSPGKVLLLQLLNITCPADVYEVHQRCKDQDKFQYHLSWTTSTRTTWKSWLPALVIKHLYQSMLICMHWQKCNKGRV